MIIESFASPLIRLYTRDCKGIANAMNEGIKVASGDIIFHLHSDDYLAHPEVLSRVARYFTSTPYQWLYGRTLLDNDGGWTPESPVFPAYSYRRLLQGNIIPHPATFVRTTLYQKMGLFDETLKYAMDYDMWLRLGKETAPAQYQEFFSVFRSHGGSATFSNRMASFDEDHAVRQKHSRPFSLYTLLNEIRVLRRRHQVQRMISTSGVKEN